MYKKIFVYIFQMLNLIKSNNLDIFLCFSFIFFHFEKNKKMEILFTESNFEFSYFYSFIAINISSFSLSRDFHLTSGLVSASSSIWKSIQKSIPRRPFPYLKIFEKFIKGFLKSSLIIYFADQTKIPPSCSTIGPCPVTPLLPKIYE